MGWRLEEYCRYATLGNRMIDKIRDRQKLEDLFNPPVEIDGLHTHRINISTNFSHSHPFSDTIHSHLDPKDYWEEINNAK